ncbi:MAG TPA: hypothetical protein VJL29_16090, partial [Thermoguttaceae bacterium]|nr:hypothetical protein [Thermoguttaceae bacterium]
MICRLLVLGGFLFLCLATAAGPAVADEATDADAARRAVDRAVEFLQKTQEPDGAFASYAGPGVTAVVAKSLKYLESCVRPDGGVYAKDSLYRNYETCLAIMVFAEANREGRYDKIIAAADRYVKGLQWDDGEGHKEDSDSYGGAG